MKIFFSVGEPSGDLHGANLIQQLRQLEPAVECMGYGGPRMAAAGCQLHHDLTELSFMWFARVMARLPQFARLVAAADRYFRHHRPDAVVLIDYPGFNWWIARRAKLHDIPVVYYGTPQIWAWAPWRARKMRRLTDHVLCKLPFEAQWYRDRGCQAVYVGHPYFDQLQAARLDREFVDGQRMRPGRLVTILPGSRDQEVRANFPVFLETARLVHSIIPDTRFAVAAFRDRHAEWMGRMTDPSGVPIQVHVGKTAELIQTAECCLACSGSVSLELLYYGKPSVIHYRIGRIAFWVQGYLRRVRYISLVNLMAAEDRYCRWAGWQESVEGGVPFPEYVTWRDRSEPMGRQITTWLTDPQAYRAACRQLDQLKSQLGPCGTSRRVAEFLIRRVVRSERADVGRTRCGRRAA